jgi:hypothetical protein
MRSPERRSGARELALRRNYAFKKSRAFGKVPKQQRANAPEGKARGDGVQGALQFRHDVIVDAEHGRDGVGAEG